MLLKILKNHKIPYENCFKTELVNTIVFLTTLPIHHHYMQSSKIQLQTTKRVLKFIYLAKKANKVF